MIVSITQLRDATMSKGHGQLYQDVMRSGKVEWKKNTVEMNDYWSGVLNDGHGMADIRSIAMCGSALKDALKVLGFIDTTNCKCANYTKEMNANGPDWCRENIDTIVSWLKESYDAMSEERRKVMPFDPEMVSLLVVTVIDQAEEAAQKFKDEVKTAV